MSVNKHPLHVLIVEANFYDEVSNALKQGAIQYLEEQGVTYEIKTVPGALEIPPVIAYAETSAQDFDAYIALGCVIRGETYHFEIVAHESARGLMDLAIHMGVAVGNGILTVDNLSQAMERASPNALNKGAGAAAAALALEQIKTELNEA